MAMTSAERVRKYRDKRKALGLKSGKAKLKGLPTTFISKSNNTIEWWSYYRETFSCQVCGESCTAAIEFHHLDPKQKTDNVSTLVNHDATIAEVLAEIAKCAVLCRNCHAKVHAGVITL